MPSVQAKDPSHTPLAHDKAWMAVRTAAYGLVAARWAQGHRDDGLPDVDGLLDRLSALSLQPHQRAYVLAWLEDAGADLGRFLYAPEIVTDGVERALARLAELLEDAGFGSLEVEAHLHRTAHVRLRAGRALADCDPELGNALVIGVLHGALGEALNTPAMVRASPPDGFQVRLGRGRDVNQEVSGRGE